MLLAWPILLAGLVLLAGATPAGVRAHEGEASVGVSPWSVQPGDEIEITADDLEPRAPVRFELFAPAGRILLAEPLTDEEGHASATVILPADLPLRYYELHASDAAGTVAVTGLRIVGSDSDGIPGPGPRESGVGAELIAAALGGLLLGSAVIAVSRPGRHRTRRADRKRS